MLTIKCDKCSKVLKYQGGLFFTPPLTYVEGVRKVHEKYHLCILCSEKVLKYIKGVKGIS